MQIGIVSDTHNRYPLVERALQMFQERKVNFVLHCGDIEDSEVIWLFRGFTAHFVLGNCDSDRLALQQAIHGIGATLHEPFGHLDLEGAKLAFVHGDKVGLLQDLVNAAHFDYLFHGHTHRRADQQVGPTRVINPGALHRANPKTCAILDLKTGVLETLVVEEAVHRPGS